MPENWLFRFLSGWSNGNRHPMPVPTATWPNWKIAAKQRWSVLALWRHGSRPLWRRYRAHSRHRGRTDSVARDPRRKSSPSLAASNSASAAVEAARVDDGVQIKLRGRKEWLILSFRSAPRRSFGSSSAQSRSSRRTLNQGRRPCHRFLVIT